MQQFISEAEALDILNKANVRIVMKPVAIMLTDELHQGSHITYREMDVIEAAGTILAQQKSLVRCVDGDNLAR